MHYDHYLSCIFQDVKKIFLWSSRIQRISIDWIACTVLECVIYVLPTSTYQWAMEVLWFSKESKSEFFCRYLVPHSSKRDDQWIVTSSCLAWPFLYWIWATQMKDTVIWKLIKYEMKKKWNAIDHWGLTEEVLNFIPPQVWISVFNFEGFFDPEDNLSNIVFVSTFLMPKMVSKTIRKNVFFTKHNPHEIPIKLWKYMHAHSHKHAQMLFSNNVK